MKCIAPAFICKFYACLDLTAQAEAYATYSSQAESVQVGRVKKKCTVNLNEEAAMNAHVNREGRPGGLPSWFSGLRVAAFHSRHPRFAPHARHNPA